MAWCGPSHLREHAEDDLVARSSYGSSQQGLRDGDGSDGDVGDAGELRSIRDAGEADGDDVCAVFASHRCAPSTYGCGDWRRCRRACRDGCWLPPGEDLRRGGRLPQLAAVFGVSLELAESDVATAIRPGTRSAGTEKWAGTRGRRGHRGGRWSGADVEEAPRLSKRATISSTARAIFRSSARTAAAADGDLVVDDAEHVEGRELVGVSRRQFSAFGQKLSQGSDLVGWHLSVGLPSPSLFPRIFRKN